MSASRVLPALLVALGGLAGGFVAYRMVHPAGTVRVDTSAPAQRAAPTSSPDNSDTPASPAAQRAAVQKTPDDIPDVRLPDLAGQSRSLREYLGRPLIVNFWATWCEPCRREMPLLSELQTREGPRLRIVGVAVDFDATVKQFLQKTHVTYPVLVGEQAGLAAAQQFGMEPVLPFSVFADAQGRIITVKVGELHRDDAEAILAAMKALAAGKLTLTQTRTSIDSQLKTLALARSQLTATP